jgi:hypothetical protein
VDTRRRRSQRTQHVLGVGHLRHALRVDEARHLDASQARGDGAAYELHLVGSGQYARLALQAVAGADFDDLDVIAHAGGAGLFFVMRRCLECKLN